MLSFANRPEERRGHEPHLHNRLRTALTHTPHPPPPVTAEHGPVPPGRAVIR